MFKKEAIGIYCTKIFGVQVLVSVVLVHQHIMPVIKTNILAVVKQIC